MAQLLKAFAELRRFGYFWLFGRAPHEDYMGFWPVCLSVTACKEGAESGLSAPSPTRKLPKTAVSVKGQQSAFLSSYYDFGPSTNSRPPDSARFGRCAPVEAARTPSEPLMTPGSASATSGQLVHNLRIILMDLPTFKVRGYSGRFGTLSGTPFRSR